MLKDNGRNDTVKRSNVSDVSKIRRQFVVQNNILTDLLANEDARSIYNLYVVFFLFLELLYTVKLWKLDFGLEFIIWSFGKLPLGIFIWVCMTAATIGMYYCFHCWSSRRASFSSASWSLQWWDRSWLFGFVIYQLCFFCLPAYYMRTWKLAPATTLAVLGEQLRMMMKSHAFVRSNTPRVTAHKTTKEAPSPPCPSFSHYLYFLFCPTLLYRDSYPRTQSIRWRVVAVHLLEMVGCIFFVSVFMEFFSKIPYRDWGLSPATLQHTLYSILLGAFFPIVMLRVTSYIVFDSWLNAAAEVLRFGDRRFYEDWWNSDTPSTILRKWNLTVQLWLYEYVYCDIRDLFRVRSKPLLQACVVLLSGLCHEYIISFTMGYWYPITVAVTPVFIALYAVLNTLLLGRGKQVLTMFVVTLYLGSFVSLQSIEYYARINCAQTEVGCADFFSPPRSWDRTPIAKKI